METNINLGDNTLLFPKHFAFFNFQMPIVSNYVKLERARDKRDVVELE